MFALTPGQLDEQREGHNLREREEWSRLTWVTANLMNATGHYKRAVQPRDLMPAKFKPAPPSVEEVQRELAEKQKRFEAAAARRKQFKVSSTAAGSVQPAAAGLRSKRPTPKTA